MRSVEKRGVRMGNKIIRRYSFDILLILFITCLFISCNYQYYEEKNGKWVLKEFPEYIFEPLDSSWEPHPPPTNNCPIFFGKKGTGTHIGVFLHAVPPGFTPLQMAVNYLSSDLNNHRTILAPAREVSGKMVFAACVNEFISFGAKVKALEAFFIVQTRKHLIGFTFKRRISVDSWDFRREKDERILENLNNSIPEFRDFIYFVDNFQY
jgi:hypothetical protein